MLNHVTALGWDEETTGEDWDKQCEWAIQNGVGLTTKYQKRHHVFDTVFTLDDVRWDERGFRMVDRDGRAVNYTKSRDRFIKETGYEIGEDLFSVEFRAWAEVSRGYDPIMEEFEAITKGIEMTPSEAYGVFEELGELLNPADKARNAKLLSKWNLGSYSRILEPGANFQQILLLEGEGGTAKTSFFQELGLGFSRKVRVNGSGEIEASNLKDLNRGTYAIFDEINTIYGRRDTENLKEFISACEDSYRTLYAKDETDQPRTFVLGATTNASDPLRDDGAGNRRYWVIRLSGKGEAIGRERWAWYRANKGRLWAATKVLWDAGERPELSEAELDLESAKRVEFMEVSDVETMGLLFAQKWVNNLAWGDGCALLTDHIIKGLELGRLSNSDKAKLKKGLQAGGLHLVQRRIGTKSPRIWLRNPDFQGKVTVMDGDAARMLRGLGGAEERTEG
jgi:hypothetical protein